MSKIGQYVFEMMEKSGEFEYDNFYSPIDLNKTTKEKNDNRQEQATSDTTQAI